MHKYVHTLYIYKHIYEQYIYIYIYSSYYIDIYMMHTI